MTANHKIQRSHSHMWLVGVFGIAAGAALMIYVPSLKAVSNVIVLFALFHLVGAFVLLASLYMIGGNKIAAHFARGSTRNDSARFDFGWAPGWIYGPWIGALVFVAVAVAIQVATPALWPLAMFLTLIAASFFAGGLIVRSSGRYEDAVLPLVDLVPSEDENKMVLDAGCGAGRTSVALGRGLKRARIVSLDRFDSDYIDGGGKRLLEQNLLRAGLAERAQIKAGDLTALPFPEEHFEAVVSAHAVDHLGPSTERGLSEIRRVLKPGGRFLLVVWVPSWTMFAVVNVLSFSLQSKRKWRRMLSSARFEFRDEGTFNGNWYALLEKPGA